MPSSLSKVNPIALLIAAVFVVALGSLLFMFAWNVFIFGVLGFTREINIIEALAGTMVINTITGALGTLFKKFYESATE